MPASENVRTLLSTSTATLGKRTVQAVYYALVVSIPFETINLSGNEYDASFTISRFFGVILFALATINWRLCFRRLPAAFWMVAWYLAVYATSQLRIPGYLDAAFMGNQMTLIQMAALFLISANLLEDSEFRRSVLRVYGWSVTCVALGMVLGIIGGQFHADQTRTSILGQDPNVSAAYFALGALCLAGDPKIFESRRFLARIFTAMLAIGVLIAAILQTGSRGGLIVFVAGILGLAACGGKKTRVRRIMIAVVVIGALATAVVREFRQGTNTASRLMLTVNRGDTAGRTDIYDAAWSMFLEKPLLGYGGANNFSTLGLHLNYPEGGIFYRDTHNLSLAVLTEVGLIGAVPFLAAMLYALWCAWRYGRRTDDALPFALMLAQIMINTSLTGYHQKLFWIMFAAAVACGLGPEADPVRELPPPSQAAGAL